MLQVQPLHPVSHAVQIFTDASKEGWGCLLWRTHRNGNLVPSRKQVAYTLTGHKRVPTPLLKPNSTYYDRKYHRGSLHKQRHEVEFTVSPSFQNTDLVFQKAGYSQSPHIQSWSNVVAHKLSRLGQNIQTEWSLLTEVFQSICTW